MTFKSKFSQSLYNYLKDNTATKMVIANLIIIMYYQ